MSIRAKYIYYGAAVLIAVCLSAICVIILTRRNDVRKEIESRLPKGENDIVHENDMIRVVIKTNGFRQITHSQVGLQARGGLRVTVDEEIREVGPSEVLLITPDDAIFQKGNIRIEAKNASDRITVTTLERGYGVPSYRGSFELISTAEGIVLVNELSMEAYLYAVVPSEMPASYEMEALKAQAVCARSYAHNQMQGYGYPEYKAHVDDSISFQVYGNSEEQETTNQAIDATKGEKAWYQGQVATTYYYSTSCGKTASIEAWGNESDEAKGYLQSVEVCNQDGLTYEKDLPWYRWSAAIPKKALANLIELNTSTKIGTLQKVTITKTGAGGIVLEIVAKGSRGSVTVQTENKIRRALGGKGYQIERQDGTVVESRELLPSAFFTIEKSGNNYMIRGGGYGHGIGMSQNGANEMAKSGKTYQEILTFFYQGIVVE